MLEFSVTVKMSATLYVLWAEPSQNISICIQSLSTTHLTCLRQFHGFYTKLMQLVNWPMALSPQSYGREQKGELPQRLLLETYFLQRTEADKIFLWVLERPANFQICSHERGLRHSTFSFHTQNSCFRL